MDTALGIAGVICVAMAVGHTAVGLMWVLPHITKESLPGSPVGGSSMSLSMVRVTWYIVTVFAASVGGILITLAWLPDADPRTVVLRGFSAMWLGATAMATWVTVRRAESVRAALAGLRRLPVPLLWIVVAVISWVAST